VKYACVCVCVCVCVSGEGRVQKFRRSCFKLADDLERIHREIFHSKKISNVENCFAYVLVYNFFSRPYSRVSYPFFHAGKPKILFISRRIPTYEDVYIPQSKAAFRSALELLQCRQSTEKISRDISRHIHEIFTIF
jgi:hypothetical protein